MVEDCVTIKCFANDEVSLFLRLTSPEIVGIFLHVIIPSKVDCLTWDGRLYDASSLENSPWAITSPPVEKEIIREFGCFLIHDDNVVMSYLLETGVSFIGRPNNGSVYGSVLEGLVRIANETRKFFEILRFKNLFHF